MVQMFVYPPKYHQEKGDAFAFHPIGTGPYIFERWDRGSQIVTVANKGYWGEKPKFDRVIWRFIRETSTKVAALETGEVDLISFFETTYADRIKANKNVVLRSNPGRRSFGLIFDRRNPPLSDKRVRKALNYAVDKKAITQHIFGGYANGLQGQLLMQAYAGWHSGLKGYPYNPERAKNLLTALDQFRDPRVIPDLIMLLKDGVLREKASAALATIGDTAIEPLIAFL